MEDSLEDSCSFISPGILSPSSKIQDLRGPTQAFQRSRTPDLSDTRQI